MSVALCHSLSSASGGGKMATYFKSGLRGAECYLLGRTISQPASTHDAITGCNGPEMFTNFIALFITHSDVGIGTIVGSEIFNLLLIVGGSIL